MNSKVSREVSSASSAEAVTPSDTATIDPPGRGLYVGVTGNVAVRMAGGGQTVTFVNVQGGSTLAICVDRVMATNTTSTDMVLLR